MRHGLYIDVLESGSPLAVKIASVAVSAVLVAIVVVPILAVGAAIVA